MDLKPYRVDIRFSDIDVMGHVNNATYFTYAEQARIYFF
ncbi:MAG: acyl-CoA thioesterase, partial [Flavobacteriales bacterium]